MDEIPQQLFENTREATIELTTQFNGLCAKYPGPIMPCALACMTYELFHGEHGSLAEDMYTRTMDILYGVENDENP